jgi:hypothetical protein
VSYRPAQCNIGRRERRKRAALAAASALVAVGYVAAYLVGAIPRFLLPGVFAPLALAFEMGLQAYESFCVTFALLGKHGFGGDGDGDGSTGRVTDPTNRRDDRLYALRISVVSFGLAAAVTALLLIAL